MHLDIYWIVLLVLVPAVLLLTGRATVIQVLLRLRNGAWPPATCQTDKDVEASCFQRIFLQVYLLVMGSEWLQGPHLYALLHDERGLSEQTVASLYAATFIAAALSAMFTGLLADRFGRRAACFAFCVIHSASSLTVLSASLPILVLGRVLAGVALTLLWTVFESWMVTEFNARGLEGSSVSLSGMFRLMTTSNCLAAIFGGLLSHCIVLALGSRTTPFVVGIFFEGVACLLMLRNWNENLGATREPSSNDKLSPHDEQPRAGRWFGDLRLWLLSFVSCFFEGTNFLILYFWAGMLQEAHQSNSPGSGIPYGVIFATFMAAMVIGALLFGALVSSTDNKSLSDEKSGDPKWRGVISSRWLLAGAILMAASDLVVLAVVESEIGIFLAFLVFEVCNGIYIPTIAYQRGIIVDEGSRTCVYGLMKIPLFIFVIGSLNLTGADGHRRRTAILLAAGSLFLAAVSSTMLRTRLASSSYLPIEDDDTMQSGMDKVSTENRQPMSPKAVLYPATSHCAPASDPGDPV